MSTIKTDSITAVSTNTAISIKGLGSGVVKLGDGELKFPDADGSANQIIETDGAGQLSFTAKPSGGLVLVQTLTLSGASTATLTAAALFDGTYDRIQIEGTAIDTSAAAAFNMTLSDDGGSTFESANYRFHTAAVVDGSTTYTAYISATASVVEVLHLTGSNADESAEFTIKTGNLVDTAFHKIFYWHGATMNATAYNFCTGVGGWAGGVTAIDQIRFLPASGTFSGVIRAYGLIDS